MTDRFTQIQDLINEQANMMCNAIGVLQGSAQPCEFNEISTDVLNEENTDNFALCIARICKDIDILVESIPPDDRSQEQVETELVELDREHETLSAALKQEVDKLEQVSHNVTGALLKIASAQMNSRPSF